MLSLEKATSKEEVDRWLEGVPDDATFDVEPKVDGLSLSAIYHDWKLSRALTRGDGENGEDVTLAALTISNLPKTLAKNVPGDLEVRGEVFIPSADFDAINAAAVAAGEEPYKNARNLASGTLKTKDVRKVAERKLSFLPWQVIGLEPVSGIALDMGMPGVTTQDVLRGPDGLEHSQALEFFSLAHACVRQPQGTRCYTKAAVWDAILLAKQLKDNLWEKGLGMKCDGIVLKLDATIHRHMMGLGSRTANWALAFKFPPDQTTTVLNGITWQVGRSGKLTPVAELEPVLLDGSTVSRATINNISYLRHDLGNPRIGDTVTLHKGGDVIPNLLGVAARGAGPSFDVQGPETCPSCSGPVTTELTPEKLDKTTGEVKAHEILTDYRETPGYPGRLWLPRGRSMVLGGRRGNIRSRSGPGPTSRSGSRLGSRSGAGSRSGLRSGARAGTVGVGNARGRERSRPGTVGAGLQACSPPRRRLVTRRCRGVTVGPLQCWIAST